VADAKFWFFAANGRGGSSKAFQQRCGFSDSFEKFAPSEIVTMEVTTIDYKDAHPRGLLLHHGSGQGPVRLPTAVSFT